MTKSPVGGAASAPLSPAMPGSHGNTRALGLRSVRDPVTILLVALLVGSWLIEGALGLVGLPHGVVGLVDLGEVLLCIVLAVWLLRERVVPHIPVVVIIYLVWVAAGLVTHAPPVSVITALKNLLLLPMLALLLASRGTTEWRARVVAATLLALACFEFLLTLTQALRTSNTDAIVGSFGPSANAVVGAVVLMGACLGLAGYVAAARYGVAGLAASCLLPLFSSWALVKFVPIALPIVAAAVALPALALRLTTWRRAGLALGAAVLSAGFVVASYAVFHPGDFKAFANFRAGTTYLESASISGVPVQQSARIGRVVLNNYANASVRVPTKLGRARPPFAVSNVTAGNYTAWMAARDGMRIPVRQRSSYVFSADVAAASTRPQKVSLQIEWRSTADGLIATTLGRYNPLSRADRHFRRLVISDVAPAGAVRALPKVAVAGRSESDPGFYVTAPPGSSVYVRALRFRRGRAVQASSELKGPQGLAPSVVVAVPETATSRRAVPGRLTQWRMAEHAISGSATTLLLGKGIGSATVAENLGVHPGDLSADAAAASYSDFGTLLVERGWIGVALVALFAAVLAGAALRIARFLHRGRWTTAFTLAVPGVVVAMAGYGMLAEHLRVRPAALTFWIVVALGLSPHSFLGGRPWRHNRGREDTESGRTSD